MALLDHQSHMVYIAIDVFQPLTKREFRSDLLVRSVHYVRISSAQSLGSIQTSLYILDLLALTCLLRLSTVPRPYNRICSNVI